MSEWQPISTAPKDGTKIILAKIAPCAGLKSFGIPPTANHIWWAVLGSWSDKWQNWNDGIEPCGLASPNYWLQVNDIELPSVPTPAGEK